MIGNNELESNAIIENIDMMCNKVTMPNRDVNTQTNRTYGPQEECLMHIHIVVN